MKPALAAPLAIFLALAAAFAIGLMRDPPQSPGDVARPLPEFALAGVGGTGPGLAASDLEGEVALVNVFASWCSSCALEHPVLMELSRSGLARLYGVAWQDTPEGTQGWLDGRGNPYLRVGDDPLGLLGLELGVTGTPETFVIDKQGQIRRRHVGPITPEIWRTELGPLVARLEAEGS